MNLRFRIPLFIQGLFVSRQAAARIPKLRTRQVSTNLYKKALHFFFWKSQALRPQRYRSWHCIIPTLESFGGCAMTVQQKHDCRLNFAQRLLSRGTCIRTLHCYCTVSARCSGNITAAASWRCNDIEMMRCMHWPPTTVSSLTVFARKPHGFRMISGDRAMTLLK